MSYRLAKQPKRKGSANDCTVRALSIAAGLTYSAAWQMLYDAQGRHKRCGFAITEFMQAEPETFGMVREIKLPAKAGEARMTAKQFALKYPRAVISCEWPTT
jgi:hypothetical protein